MTGSEIAGEGRARPQRAKTGSSQHGDGTTIKLHFRDVMMEQTEWFVPGNELQAQCDGIAGFVGCRPQLFESFEPNLLRHPVVARTQQVVLYVRAIRALGERRPRVNKRISPAMRKAHTTGPIFFGPVPSNRENLYPLSVITSARHGTVKLASQTLRLFVSASAAASSSRANARLRFGKTLNLRLKFGDLLCGGT
jgi:hypothetical protein